MVIPKREVVYEFSSNIAVAYRKVHTSLKFAQLSGSYVVVQDFPSIIGEEETLQRASQNERRKVVFDQIEKNRAFYKGNLNQVFS